MTTNKQVAYYRMGTAQLEATHGGLVYSVEIDEHPKVPPGTYFTSLVVKKLGDPSIQAGSFETENTLYRAYLP